MPQTTIDSVFAQVESGECNYGVVPVENSTEGMVSHTLDNFMDSSLKISGEVEMRIGTTCWSGHYRASDYPHLRSPAGTGPVPQLAGPALAQRRARGGQQQW